MLNAERREADMPPVVVIGAGPGIGAAVARRFARQGLPVALIARSATTLQAVAATVGSPGAPRAAAPPGPPRARPGPPPARPPPAPRARPRTRPAGAQESQVVIKLFS